jgi:SPP1 family predicted phage head-tail adaptor
VTSERLTVQAATETADGQGGASTVWADVADVWAELVPLRAAERIQAEAVGSVASYRFRTRVRADVAPAMRVRWTPRWPAGHAPLVLEIGGITIEPDRTHMILDCGVRQ